MGKIVAKGCIGYTVKPDSFTVNIDTGLIRMTEIRIDQFAFYYLFKCFQLIIGFFIKAIALSKIDTPMLP